MSNVEMELGSFDLVIVSYQEMLKWRMIVDHPQGSMQQYDCDVAFLATSLECDAQSWIDALVPTDCQQIHEGHDAVHDYSWKRVYIHLQHIPVYFISVYFIIEYHLSPVMSGGRPTRAMITILSQSYVNLYSLETRASVFLNAPSNNLNLFIWVDTFSIFYS